MDTHTIRVDRKGGVVTITLDRPDRKNAFDDTMVDELLTALAEIAGNHDDRVVVLTGAGDAFCSGADITVIGRDTPPTLEVMRYMSGMTRAIYDLPQPTIARVNGVAAGAGMNMALACDLTVASSDARFSEIFARRGLSLDLGGSWLLPRLVGLHRAKELALLADIIDATEAERIGLVNRVVPADQLDDVVDDWARRLAAGPPIALSLSKRMLNDAGSVTLHQALEDESRSQVINFGTADVKEAMKAFAAKRDPQFEGR